MNHDAITALNEPARQCYEAISRIGPSFRCGMDNRGHHFLLQLMSAVESVIADRCSDVPKARELLQRMEEALHRRDFIALADIAEYELSPLLFPEFP